MSTTAIATLSSSAHVLEQARTDLHMARASVKAAKIAVYHCEGRRQMVATLVQTAKRHPSASWGAMQLADLIARREEAGQEEDVARQTWRAAKEQERAALAARRAARRVLEPEE